MWKGWLYGICVEAGYPCLITDENTTLGGVRGMKRLCRIILSAFALLYLAALGLLAIGTFGLFGSPQGPLSGVFLMPLGLPWNLLLDGLPGPLLPWVGMGAPLLNLLGISLICRLMRRKDTGG